MGVLGLPRVTKCCFCFSLRIGTIIIGYLSLIFSVGALGSLIFVTYRVASYVRENHTPPPGHTPEELQRDAIRIYILHSIYMLLQLYYFIISLLLVIGAHKYEPRYMRWYFIAGIANLSLELLMVIVFFVFAGFVLTAPQLIICGVTFYFLVVVRSLYLEIEESQKPEDYEMKTTQARLMA